MPSEAHEQVVQVLLDNPTPDETSLADRRAGFEAAMAAMPVPDDVSATRVDAGGVDLEWVVTPEADEDRVVLMTHGGGYCMGTTAAYRELAARVSRAAGARVAVVDYRLAPEWPCPAAIDDCLTAYRWLLDQGVAAPRISLLGDSGGAGLALALAARIRDAGLELPGAVIGLSPWIDLEVGDGTPDAADVGDPMLTRGGQRLFAEGYLQGHDATDPAVNALYGDPRGLPPVLLQTGSRDLAHGDALRWAQRARAAGVDVTVTTFHGLVHNWMLWPHLPEAAESIDAVGAFLGQPRDGVAATKESAR